MLLDGSRTSPEEPLLLRAGPLKLRFESGGLRYIRLGERELVRRIYSAVRDANWGTVPDRLSKLTTRVCEDSFEIEFDAHNCQGEIDFAWHGTIRGTSSGRIEFAMEGGANTTFSKNRIGFCVLHPMQLAGSPVQVQHADGSSEHTVFPDLIAAQNPFHEVVALRHPAAGGGDLRISFEGDLFETEDQRNWIDASFKTFCTPLSRPFPAQVCAGDRIAQRVVLELLPSPPVSLPRQFARAQPSRDVTLDFGAKAIGPLPQIGFGLSPDAPHLTAAQVERLRQLKPQHLRCELNCPGGGCKAFDAAAAIASQLDSKLEIALFLGEHAENEFCHLLESIQRRRASVARWMLFPLGRWNTTAEVLHKYAPILRECIASIPIGGGTPANFCELNRCRPPSELLDFVTWSFHPQEHASDNASLAETLAAQAATVQTARHFAAGRSFAVGPITLKKRVNPYATGPWPPEPAPGALPCQVDARQASLFGAGWTLGSLKYLAESGVHSATYYELLGWKGLMEREGGSPLPQLFSSLPGGVFPLYHVFADLAEWPGAQVLGVQSSDPLAVEALALASDSLGESPPRIDCLLIASLSGEPQRVSAQILATSARVRLLSEDTVLESMATPENYRASAWHSCSIASGRFEIDLPPFALARVDFT
jgi:hypothetical protein